MGGNKMPKIEGGCLCGAVRYESNSEPAVTAICHCKHCQKQAGSAFSIVVGVPKDSLIMSGDELKTYEDYDVKIEIQKKKNLHRVCHVVFF